MTNYLNEASQAERRRQLKNDQVQATPKANTLHERAQRDADAALGGRYSALSKQVVVSGGTSYPPAGGHWRDNADTAPEPPLGYSVNDLEPCGTYAEIQSSLAGTPPSVPSGVSPSPSHDVEPKVGVPATCELDAGHVQPPEGATLVERPSSPLFKRRF